MDRIESESFGFVCPCLDDEFVGREPLERLQATAEIVCVDEVEEVAFKLVMAIVVIALDGRFLDGPVHALDLTVRPRMTDLGETVLDAVLLASHVEHVRHISSRWPVGVTWREGELNAVVGKHRMDFVRDGFDESDEKSRSGCSAGLLDQLNEGEFARAINGDIEIELALGGVDLGDVDMEIADWISFEFLLRRFIAFDLGQPGYVVALETSMQRRPGQMRDRRLPSSSLDYAVSLDGPPQSLWRRREEFAP